MAAEILALTKAAEQSLYVRDVLSELFGLKDRKCLPINVITDNKSPFDSINSTKTVDDKQLLTDISCIPEKLANLELHNVLWADPKRQLADCLTKIVTSSSKLIEVL